MVGGQHRRKNCVIRSQHQEAWGPLPHSLLSSEAALLSSLRRFGLRLFFMLWLLHVHSKDLISNIVCNNHPCECPHGGLLCNPPNYNRDSLSWLEGCPDLYSMDYAFFNAVHLVSLSCVYSVKTCSVLSTVFVICFQLSMTRVSPITTYYSTV